MLESSGMWHRVAQRKCSEGAASIACLPACLPARPPARPSSNFPKIHLNLLAPNVNYSGRTAPLTSKVAFYIFIQQIYVRNILNIVYTLGFFSSKCSLFHNYNIFGSCIIHILYTGCAKIKKIIPAPKG